jgi:segregation and condensation protein A
LENKRFSAGSITDAENNGGSDDYIVADKGNSLVNSSKTEKYVPNTVKLEFFEGPLDLLLSLIKKKKINIYDIPIKEITEDYLNAIGISEDRFKSDNNDNNGKAVLNPAGINIDIGGDFIVMAAHLIYIKSLMLLPKTILSDESSSENGITGADPRHELANMLIEYQKVKEIAYYLDNKPILGRDVFNINISNNTGENINNNDNNSGIADKSGSLLFEANVYALSKAFYGIAKEAETRIDSYELKKTKFSIKEKIIEVVNILQDLKIIKFSELILVCCNEEFKDNNQNYNKDNNGCTGSSIYGRNKELFIIYFLSILEMSRLAIIRIDQEEYFGEIYISLSDEDGLLNYESKIENIS